jgi:hypothetical protein
MNVPESEAEGIEIVLLGSFNPKIFHPAWFRRYDLINEADVEDSTVRLVTNDVSDIEMRGIHSVCIKNRMSLSSDDPSRYEMIHDWLLEIFRLLPHMPITALGINLGVHYRVNDLERLHRIGHQLAPKDPIWSELFEKPGMRSLTIEAPRKDDLTDLIHVTVEPSVQFAPGLFVRANHHFQPTDGANIEVFSSFADSNWQTACREARRVAEKIFEKIP